MTDLLSRAIGLFSSGHDDSRLALDLKTRPMGDRHIHFHINIIIHTTRKEEECPEEISGGLSRPLRLIPSE